MRAMLPARAIIRRNFYSNPYAIRAFATVLPRTLKQLELKVKFPYENISQPSHTARYHTTIFARVGGSASHISIYIYIYILFIHIRRPLLSVERAGTHF